MNYQKNDFKYTDFFMSDIITEAVDIPPAHIQSHQTLSPFSTELIKYIKTVENGIKKGYNNGKWHIYQDPTGPHIGYGHKIKGNELQLFKDGISEEAVDKLLIQDLSQSKKIVYDDIKNMFRVNIPTLEKRKEEMLIDFAYNLGTLKEFPKFVRAVLMNDWKTATQEYKRTAIDKKGNKIELARNKAFFNTFLTRN